MRELMERVTRANPVPSGEATTPDERREAELLLERLVAEPLTKPRQPRRPRPRRRPRRLALAGALLAALGAAGLAAVDLIDPREGRDGILDLAVAAVSEEDVIYAVTERFSVNTRKQEPGAKTRRETRFRRYWLWRGGRRSRFLDYRAQPDGTRGRLVGEAVSDGSRLRWWIPRSDSIHVFDMSRGQGTEHPSLPDGEYPGFDPFSDPGRQLRGHVEDGSLRVAGRTTSRGRDAYRLVSGRLSHPSPGTIWTEVTYLVDAKTFLPLAIRDRTLLDFDPSVPGEAARARAYVRIDYLRYERLPVTDANKALLEMSPHPGADRFP
jgi:hypothetical protein